MRIVFIIILLTIFATLAGVALTIDGRYEILDKIETDWKPVAFASPDGCVSFLYTVAKTGEPGYLLAVIVFETDTAYRLIGGIGIHKDILKSDIKDVFIFAVRERE